MATEETKETEEKELKELQNTCRDIINAFKDESTNIQRALQQYKSILSNYQNNNDIYTAQQRDYIFNPFIEDSVRTLMEREHTFFHSRHSDWVIIDEITNCCKILIWIAVPFIKEDSNVSRTIIHYCMNHGMPFFEEFGHDWRQKRGYELSTNEMKALEINQAITGLTRHHKNDHIDYLLENRWRYGMIHNIETTWIETAAVKELSEPVIVFEIQPLMDLKSNIHRPVDNQIYTEKCIYSHCQIAKPLTKSIEQRPHMLEWRMNLSKNASHNKCDVLDSVHKWYTCTIVEDDPAANRIKIHYDGWSARYDEWIQRDKINIQPHLSHATGGRETNGVVGHVDELEPCLEDEEDTKDDNVYAVWRGALNNISFHLVDILNEFGKCGGFDAVLDRLKNAKPPISIDTLCDIVSPLAHVYKCYTKQFAETFVKPLLDCILDIARCLGENELTYLRKNNLEHILDAVECLMSRHCRKEGVNERMTELRLIMTLKRLRCLNADRRMEAAQYISDVCYAPERHRIEPTVLAKWIKENNVLYSLFGPSNDMLNRNAILISGYIRMNYDAYFPFDVMKLIGLWYNQKCDALIMKQSVDVLKFTCTDISDINVEFDHVGILWNIMERNANQKDVCGIAIDILQYLNEKDIECLVTKIQELDLSLITINHLWVMLRTMDVFKERQLGDQCMMFLWDIIQDDVKCDESLVEFAMNTLGAAAPTHADCRDTFMLKCINNLREHNSVCVTLRFLSILLKNGITNDMERYIMIQHLIDNEKLLKIYVDDIIHFKQYSKQQMTQKAMYKDRDKSDGYVIDSDINDLKLFIGNRTYLEEVKGRVKFLNFLFKNYDHLKLNDEDKDILYSHFIENGETNEERIISIIKLKDILMNDVIDEHKYPLLEQDIDINEEDSDKEEDESPQEDMLMFQGNENISAGIDPSVLAAFGYTDAGDAEQQVLLQSLMAQQAELYQSFQQQNQ